jgi:Ca2+-binding EF-hand superfamily protein
MLTDLQKRKLNALFNLYDVDKNGFVEQADFEQIVHNLATTLGFQPGSPAYTRLHAGHMAIWNNVQQLSGAPGHQRVTLEEFLAGHDRLLSAKDRYLATIGHFGDSVIELSDQDGDGRLSQQEYVANLRSFNVDEAAANEAFRRLDRDGDGYLTHDEISRRVEEFFYSDDPQAPGNWLMGPF